MNNKKHKYIYVMTLSVFIVQVLVGLSMGGCFKWFRQNIVGSCVEYEIAQAINTESCYFSSHQGKPFAVPLKRWMQLC